MAVTNGWGQGVINNTNGFGKLATNNIGAGSIYENSYAGDTALIGTSAAFSYSSSSFTQADSNPTPTITGTTGGTFSGTSGLVFVSTSTGEINLSASTIAAHVVTYTVDGVSATFNLSVLSPPYASTSSFSFDGINDYFDISTIGSTLQSLNTGALSFWIYPTQISGTKTFFGYGNDTTTTDFFSISTFTSGKLRILFRNDASGIPWASNGADLRTNSNVISTNNWYNICLVSNGSSYTLYLNGSPITLNVDAGSNSGKWFGDISGATMNKTFIGAKESSSSIGSYFKGNIDEVSIWNTTLSQNAVTEIYNSGAPNSLTSLTHASSSNLVAWYKM